jgi:phosphonate transport system substrate-binding protein
MSERFPGFICVLLLALSPVAAFTANTAARTADAEKVYTFGVVPQFEQRKLVRIWRPILNELEQRTGLKFRLVGTPKIPAFEQQFLAGEFDFAYMNPYHVISAHDSQGYQPLVRDGGRTLKGVIVVPKDSPITSPAELADAEMAFPSPNALGASLLIRADLFRQFGVSVKPRYVQTHSSVYLHVANKLVAGGGGVGSTLKSQTPSVRDSVRIIYETRGIPPHPVTAHPRVPAAHRALVQQALLDLAASDEGKTLLAGVPILEAVSSSIEDYTVVKSLGLEEFYMTD